MIRTACERSKQQQSTKNLRERTVNINVHALFWLKRDGMGIVQINAIFNFIFHNHPKDTITIALKALIKPFEAPHKKL